MYRRTQGFTIVELLIVIVVIAILAAISVVAFNNIQTRARNTARATQIAQVAKLFELYRTQNGAYPVLPTGGIDYCVGTGYPYGKCRDSKNNGVYGVLESNTALSSKLATVGTIPNGNYYPVNDSVGPYVHTAGDNASFSLLTFVEGEDVSACPSGMAATWNEATSSKLLCSKTYQY